jgi:methyl-accepting chemotaxis protein
MHKYKLSLSVLGIILQIGLLFLLTRRLNLWSAIFLYYALFMLTLFIFNIAVDRNAPLRRYSLQTFFIPVIAAIVAGVLAGYVPVNIVWIAILGMVSSSLAASAVYQTARLVIPGGLAETGFDPILETGITFFSIASFMLFMTMQLTLSAVLLWLVVLVVLSAAAGYATMQPVIQTGTVMSKTIESGQEIESASFAGAAYGKVTHMLGAFIKKTRNAFSSVGDMGQQIKTLSEDLSAASQEMNASLEEVSSTVQHIAKGSQEQSNAITSIAQSIEGLNKLTTGISSQVKMASVSSQKTTTSAKHGMELARKEAQLSKEIFEQTRFIEDKMTQLRDQSGEIKKILDIIASINEQTDLLAINAAIEAARVGEQGRGFAVVADEIRNLATETKRSSQVVESLIMEINKTIQELGALLTSERDKTTESNALAAESEQQYTGIVKAVDVVFDMISRINQAAANQADNTRNLVDRVEQIAKVAGETASSTEEVSAAVQEQTASMQEFTSTAQILNSFAVKLEELLKKLQAAQ